MSELPVGFIGLGIMGEGMVRRLATDGVKLVVWNRSRDKSEALKKEHSGVCIADSVGDLVKACGTVVSMLSNLEASESVFPLVEKEVHGRTSVIDCATLTPEAMQKMAAAVKAKGGKFLEAPVSGTKKPAADGTLIFLAAGDREVFDANKSLLDRMGKVSRFYGPTVGQGTRMKLIVNMTMGSMMATISEGIALAEASDLGAEDFMQVIGEGAMACPMFNGKAQNFVKREYPPAFPLKHAHKDMRFALGLGKELDVELPVATASEAQFQKAGDRGDEDFSALREVCKKK
ncbi:Glyoxylate/succinic semialdehyde reductase 1 [Diplonema papillatum]|nr:Glyoxylate/succinic semialdehyde reductase 1 [Diplonema papillatum]|eukprot:gene5925-9074_t